MDVLTEFELKYFESKDLLGGIQQRLAAFADDSLDEKAMDERAKKKVDQLWENHSAAKKDDFAEESEAPKYSRVTQLFDLGQTFEEKIKTIGEEANNLFKGTIVASQSTLVGEKVEPKLSQKPKKRIRRTKKDICEAESISKQFNALLVKEAEEVTDPEQQEQFFNEVLGEDTLENLGEGPFSIDGLQVTKQELMSLHPDRFLSHSLHLYLLDKLLSIRADQSKFPGGLCVFDLDFCREYKTKVLPGKDSMTAFHHIVKEYTKRLRAKPKTIVFLIENDGHHSIAVASSLWINECDQPGSLKSFSSSPAVLILDPVCSMSAPTEDLIKKIISSLADYMNGMMDAQVCLQKAQAYQLMLRRAESIKEGELMFLTYIAAILANCSELFEANPKNLSKIDWIAKEASLEMREYFTKYIVTRIVSAPGYGQVSDLVDGTSEGFEKSVLQIVSKKGEDKPSIDNVKFKEFLVEVGIEAEKLPEEEVEKLRVEFYYIN